MLDDLLAKIGDEELRARIAGEVDALRGRAERRDQREYRLVYAGKQSESEILATTPALPFQRIRSFGEPPAEGWHNLLVQGDNLPVLRRLIAMRREGLLRNADGTDGVRLVYIDPPFASDEDYENKAGKIAYSAPPQGCVVW